jgi:radical SAM superfamily enzyme YgiQ (UPF0313 family)
MKLGLVTAAIATDFEDAGDAEDSQVRGFSASPQLGPLSLASIAEQVGALPYLINLDRLYYRYLGELGSRGLNDFPAWVAPLIVASGADIYGFSSICSSYPLQIRIAEFVKRERPDCTIVFGGPQASVVDLSTLSAFPFIDFILRGESERSLPLFLEEWSGKRQFAAVPGLTYHTPFGPARNPDAPIIQDLDSLPLPAYHLTDELNGAPFASLEIGRGCPFSCTFCSTNDFFRRKFRMKSPRHMLHEMRVISRDYGIDVFELTHDMFTVDRKRVVAFCRQLLESGERFLWTCSARTDCVDEELLELMAAAGCKSLFFGVETGSRRMQRIIDKDLDPDRAKAVVEIAERVGIETTVSLITGFPEENPDDLRETVGMYMHSLRHAASSPQVNLLAPLASTPIFTKYKDQMVLEEFGSEMSHQGRMHNGEDRQLIRKFPEIFPNFYLLPTPDLDRNYCLELREFFRVGKVRMRWLLVALHQCGSGFLDVFSAWRSHRMQLRPDLSGGGLRSYYMLHAFVEEFIGFVRRHQRDFQSPAVNALLDSHEKLIEADARDSTLTRTGTLVPAPARATDVPVRAPQLHVIELYCDIQQIIDSLKRGQPVVANRTRKVYRTEQTEKGPSRLIEITPLVARGLELCDGRHTVEQFTAGLAESFDGAVRLRRQGAKYLLEGIHKKGFIEIYRSASRADSNQEGAGAKSAYRLSNALASPQNQLSIQEQ